MGSLDDDKELVIAELMHLLVGPADVGNDRQLLAVVLEQNRVVRGHETSFRVGDEGRPWVLSDEAPDLSFVRELVVGVLSHGADVLKAGPVSRGAT